MLNIFKKPEPNVNPYLVQANKDIKYQQESSTINIIVRSLLLSGYCKNSTQDLLTDLLNIENGLYTLNTELEQKQVKVKDKKVEILN